MSMAMAQPNLEPHTQQFIDSPAGAARDRPSERSEERSG